MLIAPALCVLVLLWRCCQPATSGRFSNVTEEQFLNAILDANPEIALRVRAIVSDQLDVPLGDIHPDSHFVDDLKAD